MGDKNPGPCSCRPFKVCKLKAFSRSAPGWEGAASSPSGWPASRTSRAWPGAFFPVTEEERWKEGRAGRQEVSGTALRLDAGHGDAEAGGNFPGQTAPLWPEWIFS